MKVYFIGAGPGAADLITIRGADILLKAPIVLYAGSLVPVDLLKYCGANAEIHDTASLDLDKQVEIYKRAKENNLDVARLQSGDPSIYGAIAEQMRKLDELEIEYEIIPGVSSFASAAAVLSCELTKPNVSQTIILTRKQGRASAIPDREAISKLAAHGATMCIFLSGTKLEEVVEELKPYYAPDTTVALVHKASWREERKLVSTLSNLIADAKSADWKLTTLLLVGEVLNKESGAESRLYSPTYSHRFRKARIQAGVQDGSEMERVDVQRSRGTKATEHIGIWLVRKEALKLGQFLEQKLNGILYCPWQESEIKQSELFARDFKKHKTWVLVMATGIASRFISNLAYDKLKDPAVVVLDEGCNFAISLLGGHEMGANKLAYKVASLVGAVPAISTATEALKPLVLGIGCRRGVSATQIEKAVHAALNGRQLNEVRLVATIDLKKDEAGLLEFCQNNDLPLQIFTKESVIQRNWTTEKSAWVKEVVGSDGVCEPCALMASSRGRLLIPKMTMDGVAVAIVEDNFVVPLEENSLVEMK